MKVIRAKSAGFCIGVSLALRRLDQELTVMKGGKAMESRLITFGPIIHNPLVMRHYTEQGVLCINDPLLLRSGDRVVIRAHGIPWNIEEQIRNGGVHIVDATCPKVKKAQLAIAGQQAKGRTLLLFGEREHPEVKGLLSYADEHAQVFADLDELDSLELVADKRYFLAAQTTQERAIFQQAKEIFGSRLSGKIRTLDTICDATRNRQQEAIDLAKKVDCVVVVGGFNSGNTRRLAEVVRGNGIPALHVEQVSDLGEELLAQIPADATVIGLTAGASTPDEHIHAVEEFLQNLNASAAVA